MRHAKCVVRNEGGGASNEKASQILYDFGDWENAIPVTDIKKGDWGAI